jgi:hypothetical protein
MFFQTYRDGPDMKLENKSPLEKFIDFNYHAIFFEALAD